MILKRKNEEIEITKEQFKNLILNTHAENKRREKLSKSEIGRNILKSEKRK